MTRKQIKQIVEETKKIKQKNINLSSQLAEHIRENYSNIVYHYEDIKVIEAITESIVNRTTDSVSELANVFLENLKRGVAEGSEIAVDRKTGKVYNPNKEMDKLLSQHKTQFQGMAAIEKAQAKKKAPEQGVAAGGLNEIGYADDLDDSNFSSDRLLKLGKVVGQIEGNDVMMASGGSEKVYFLVVDNQVSAFLGFRNNQLKNIKNFTNTDRKRVV